MANQPDRDTIIHAFHDAVNMTPAELERWLETEESQSVGWQHEGESESVGHQSGRRIVEILRRRKAEMGEDDLDHMRKVTGYVHRHLTQGGPAEGADSSRWRYSLMNWGHDPMKKRN